MAHLQDKELYVLDAWAGTDPAFRLPIRVVNEFAWHNLFARNMFLPEDDPQEAPRIGRSSRSSTRRTSNPIPRVTARVPTSSSSCTSAGSWC